MTIYSKGDRVRLVSTGGYGGGNFFVGAQGTVVSCVTSFVGSNVMVPVDNTEHSDGLCFYSHEIELISKSRFETLIFEGKYGDQLEVLNNTTYGTDLYFRLPELLKGVVLNKEQALLLADKIQQYFR